MMSAVKNKIFWLLVFALTVIATKGIWSSPSDLGQMASTTIAGHEWQYNVYRILAMGSALEEFNPGRWTENFSMGWGYPLFQYTGPLPYTLGGILVNLGVSPIAALNTSWLVVYLGAACLMFWACRPIFGSAGALLAATCYVLAPYHLVDTYIRTNLVETSAFIFPPLIIRGLWQLRSEPRKALVIGALGIALLPLTHMLSTYMIGLGLAVFTLVYALLLPKSERVFILKHSCIIAALGLSLSAFFWLPALVDITAIRGSGAITEGYYHFANHFVYPAQLIDPQWHYGGSEIGPKDYMSFSLGGTTLTLAGLVVLGLVVVAIKRRKVIDTKQSALEPLLIAAFVAGLVMTLMTLALTAPIWHVLPGVANVQFPWRFLFPASFFLAVFVGALPKILEAFGFHRFLSGLVGLALVAVVVIQYWDYAKEGAHDGLKQSEMTDKHFRDLGVWTTNNHEFMPADVEIVPYTGAGPDRPVRFFSDSFYTSNRIASVSMGNGFAKITLLPGAPGQLQLNQHWHPGWRASVDGVEVETRANTQHRFAPILIDVSEQATSVEFRFGYSSWGRLGLWISALALVFIILSPMSRLPKNGVIAAISALFLLWFYGVSGMPKTETFERKLKNVNAQVEHEQLPAISLRGDKWDNRLNKQFDERGVSVTLTDDSKAVAINGSFDANDSYWLAFIKAGKLQGRSYARPVKMAGGMQPRYVEVPQGAVSKGFDEIKIIPISGDGFYSLGHLKLLEKMPEQLLARDKFGVPQVALAKLSEAKPYGYEWNGPDTHQFDESGIVINLDNPDFSTAVSLSLDSNDDYQLFYLLKGKTVAASYIKEPSPRPSGLMEQKVSVPTIAREKGFDQLALKPVRGDGFYSLGHLLLK